MLGERLHLLLQRLQVLAADLRLEVELLEVVAGLDGVRGVWVGRLRRDRPGVGGVRPRGRRLGSRVGDWGGWPRWWQRTRPLILVARGGLRGELGLDLFLDNVIFVIHHHCCYLYGPVQDHIPFIGGAFQYDFCALVQNRFCEDAIQKVW